MDDQDSWVAKPPAAPATPPTSPTEGSVPPAPPAPAATGPAAAQPPAVESLYGTPTPAGGLAEPTLVPLGEPVDVGAVAVARRPRRARWAVAAVVGLAIVLLSGGAFMFLAGASGRSLTASYVPKTSLFFATVRVDLPGDQHQKLADLASHFPGFSDRSAFDTKLDEALNDALKSATNGELSYTSDMKTWMSGEVSVAMTSYPPSMSLGQDGTPSATMPDQGMLAVVSLKDKSKAQGFVTDQLKKHGLTTTAGSYAGQTLNLDRAHGLAYSLLDNVLLIGSPNGVKAGLDSAKNGSLDGAANYQAARKALPGDRLAWVYVDYAAIMKGQAAATSQAQRLPSPLPSDLGQDFVMPTLDPALAAFTAKLTPAWVAGAVRAESDHLVVDLAMPRVKALPGLSNTTSDLAARLPATTIAVYEMHSISAVVNGELALFGGTDAPQVYRDAVSQIRAVLERVGGVDQVLGWLGDGAVAVTDSGGKVAGGLVVQAPDAKTAADKVGLVRNAISLLGGSASVTASETTYKGTSILLLSSPASGTGDATLAIASHGNLVIAGYGVDFVKSVIDASSSSSLASQPRYQAAIKAAGSSNALSAYVDVPGFLTLAQEMRGSLESLGADGQAYLKAIDSLAFTTVDGDTQFSHIVVMAH